MLPLPISYRQLNKFIEEESFEPKLSWGLRMAITAIIPVLWGMTTGHIMQASWITLTAECICWVELKGAFTQRMWVLVFGTLLAILFCWIGTVAAPFMLVSVIAMFLVVFLAGLFKNLGERGAGLALSAYVMFIVCNAYPVETSAAIKERMWWVGIGGVWSVLIGFLWTLFMPLRQPYRRSIALIWKANASLLVAIAKGWDGIGLRSNIRTVYEKEKTVRTAIDSSLQLFENRHFQVKNIPLTEQELAKLRKQTALVGVHIVAIGDELANLKLSELPKSLRLKIHSLLTNLEHVVNSMATYTLSLKQASLLVVRTAVETTHQQIQALVQENETVVSHQQTIKRLIQLSERSVRIIESSLTHLENAGEDKTVLTSYSFLKTLYLLQPGMWIHNTKLLFNFNTHTIRYILRSSLAAALAVWFYKWFHIDHGYWLAFTVVLVMQPYFGATLKKALDRVIGTLTGGIVGGLLTHLDDVLYLREVILFISFVSMVYYVKNRYSIAAFFITVSLVLLFDVENAANTNIIIMRAVSTIGGACLAILAGFALLPDWDSKWLPKHLVKAIHANYNYFHAGILVSGNTDWTRMKRLAETANSSAFDSFNRFLSEPGAQKKSLMHWYHVILNNVHITRELNNIHVDDALHENERKKISSIEALQLIESCNEWFLKIVTLSKQLDDLPIKQQEWTIAQEGYEHLSEHQLFCIYKMHQELQTMHQNLLKLYPEAAR